MSRCYSFTVVVLWLCFFYFGILYSSQFSQQLQWPRGVHNKTVLFYVCEIQEPNKTKIAMNANRSHEKERDEVLQCCNSVYVKMYIWTLNKYVNAFHTHLISFEIIAMLKLWRFIKNAFTTTLEPFNGVCTKIVYLNKNIFWN